MPQFVYTMHQVGKIVPPKREILKDISLSFFPGAKIGVLGLNGSGKSTLLRIMAGEDSEIQGEARAQPGIKVGYLPQEPHLDESKDVRGNVEDGIKSTIDLIAEFNSISDRFAEPLSEEEMNELLEKQGTLQNEIDAVDGWQIERTLEIAADALRLPPWEDDVNHLSGGEKRRVALCRLLLSKPDMLLLDEPTNHLDAESVAWLERYLQDYSGTVVAITHDRYFLDNAAGWILELDRGHGIPYEGNYSAWLEAKEKRLAVEEKQQSAHEKTIKSELEWIRANPKGRQSKSKARIARFEELNSQSFQSRNETQELYIPPGTRLGDKVLEVKNLSKGFGSKSLIENLNFSLPKGSILGIVGGNGAGKTTFLRMLVSSEKPDSGTIELGETVKLAYVDQSRDELDGEKTVWQEISDGQDNLVIGNYEIASRAYASRFNFRGGDQQKFVKDLSGGERNRLHMAKLLKKGGNVLLLDEPTNDLDVETLRALEEGLLAFPGSAIVVSHDRWFVSQLATRVVEVRPNEIIDYQGSYEEYVHYCGDDHLDADRVVLKARREKKTGKKGKNRE